MVPLLVSNAQVSNNYKKLGGANACLLPTNSGRLDRSVLLRYLGLLFVIGQNQLRGMPITRWCTWRGSLGQRQTSRRGVHWRRCSARIHPICGKRSWRATLWQLLRHKTRTWIIAETHKICTWKTDITQETGRHNMTCRSTTSGRKTSPERCAI